METLEITAQAAWSPYLVGALIGILVCVSLWSADRPVGASSAYATLAGVIGKKFFPRHLAGLSFFKDHSVRPDWSLVFVGGIVLGGFIAAWTGGELTFQFLPQLWTEAFGEGSYILRAFTAVTGGILLAFGARMAGGCTSGHGISGALQLSSASWLALICFFVGGVAAAFLLYGASL